MFLRLPDPVATVLRRPGVTLGAMLLALHAAIIMPDAVLARAFLLVHYGLFLLWQPVVQTETPLLGRRALPVFAVAGLLVAIDSPWVLGFWILVLIGLVGASAVAGRGGSRAWGALAALAYLFIALYALVLPEAVAQGQRAEDRVWVTWVAWGLPLAVLLMPGRVQTRADTLDFVYGLMLALLAGALALAVFAVIAVKGEDYLRALLVSLGGMAGLLFLLAWLWSPRAGFAGLGGLASRYMLTVGLPFERWVSRLARCAGSTSDADDFMRMALADCKEMPWVLGGRWHTSGASGSFGGEGMHTLMHDLPGLSITWFCTRAPSPALAIQMQLASRLLGYFHAAKLREQTLRELAYVQAIHDTGARLTHDVKNLLQSMQTLLAAVESATPEEGDRLHALMRRQMPVLTNRLAQTLDKLRTPRLEEVETVSASVWWQALLARHTADGIGFQASPEPGGEPLPRVLFDSVAENLIANALRKRQDGSGVAISVRFSPTPLPVLTVSDTGEPVPLPIAQRLFMHPVSSNEGLGVGLYQAARQAASLGYRLTLRENRPGAVVFALEARGSDPSGTVPS